MLTRLLLRTPALLEARVLPLLGDHSKHTPQTAAAVVASAQARRTGRTVLCGAF